jgi:hypothetical protein
MSARTSEHLEPPKGSAAREALRRSFRPAHVRVLFVGEAPPLSTSGSFFYEPGSSRHRVVQRVFEKAFELRFGDDEFLGWFARAGCYLEDLSHDPVDGLTEKTRRALYDRGTERLAVTLAELRPTVVISLLRRIAPHVRTAAERADLDAELVEVPYPDRWPAHRIVFERTLVRGLRRWHRSGVLVLPARKPG